MERASRQTATTVRSATPIYNARVPFQSRALLVILTALSVSIGWGIRGQFGHEYGAALAGAIGGMAVALLSGREDWRRRIHYFAALGAIGFGFGGSMSYMKTVAYAHSSDSATVIYGFACVFVLGFIWAAPAGTGIALPAYLNRDELTKVFVPLSAVFVSWYLQDVVRGHLRLVKSDWYEFVASYRMSAVLAAAIVIVIWIFWRKYWGVGTSLILHMAIGWWVGNLVFIRLMHLDMNPPRGDTWAECLGLVGGISGELPAARAPGCRVWHARDRLSRRHRLFARHGSEDSGDGERL